MGILKLLGFGHEARMKKCVLCGNPAIGRSGICINCLEKLPPTPGNTREIEGVDKLVAAFEYKEPLVTLMHTFKYDGHKYASEFFAHAMARLDEFDQDCVLMSVPLHSLREAERGFSQTDELCRHLCQLTHRQWIKTALQRIRNTVPQTQLTGAKRLANLDDAFFARGVKGLHIILVDDVVTTGATLRECAKTLKAAGAAKVYALVACAADKEPEE